ncbi:P-loop containing nucleoside triphosphate hydrolase protein [Cladochytrium replicatum]|nr:P-loop containing nucleoside triphosphate hydrolase protein [Cladochytrium replicatum]
MTEQDPHIDIEEGGDHHAKQSKKERKSSAEEKDPVVPLFSLWRYASRSDLILICVASVLSAGIGALIPAAITVFGAFLDGNSAMFAGVQKCVGNQLIPPIDMDSNSKVILMFVYFGIAMMFAGYFSQMLWVLTGENQSKRIREKYVAAILRQDMGWFDKAEEGSLTTRLAQDTQLIQDGISEKAGLTIQALAQFVTGFVIAFVKGWKLALVLLAAFPVLGIVGVAMFSLISRFVGKGQNAYADAGAIAEQAIAGIRTVASFSLQKRFEDKYEAFLEHAHKADIGKGLALGSGFGGFMMTIFCTYGLGFWYGSRLVLEGFMLPANVLVVFFAMLIGAFGLITLPTNASAVSQAMGAAGKIYRVIERIPDIDPYSESGKKADSISGEIVFKRVAFSYPSRPDVTILHELSLTIKPGMTVAFVGPSGSGKSTSVGLIQRFYKPLSGSITLDGVDIAEYNVKWLRSQIGVVSQEPVLFNTTIKQNILMGATKAVSEAELVEVCKKANCHNFIQKLPHKYDTFVGEHGGMMSGGQKQRIAIARALIKNPRVLLLDEATSALDTASERVVQTALDVAAKDRTTIVIAHRLSTIRNADLIVVLDKGRMVESGTHDELVTKKGVYNDLVEKQRIRMEVETKLNDVEEGGTTAAEFGTDTEDAQVSPLKSPKSTTAKQVIPQLEHNNDQGSGNVVLQLETFETLKRQAVKKAKDTKAANLEQKKQKTPIFRVLKLMHPEWPRMILGVLAAAVAGCVFPVFSLIFTRVITELFIIQFTQKEPDPFSGAYLYAFIFVCIGVTAFLSFFTQVFMFESAGGAMTKRLRAMTFKAILRQEIGFFDLDGNSLGALSTQLATEASKVGELVTKVWGEFMQLCATAVCGLTIAFYHSWQLTLILIATIPILSVGTYFESRALKGFEDSTKKSYEESGEIAAEAFKEIRTVTSLNRQSYFEERFKANIERPHRLAQTKAYTASIGNGNNIHIYFSKPAFTQLVNALGFYAGLRLADACVVELGKVFTVIMAATITAQGLGRSSTFLQTFQRAKIAAIKVFELIDRPTQIDPDTPGDAPSHLEGDFEFKDIAFTYPARPSQPIFTGGFNLIGKRNQMVALVGPSGCGKSTTIGMLERWYDPLSGTVTIDNTNVKSFQLKEGLRKHLSIVGQEPVLFDMSVRENILYGTDRVDVTEAEIDEVAKMANIYDFLKALPNGYQTRVGDKGSQLSGGQKQRIAIARALIRRPRILLLDEATSALDSESEKIVQEAIDRAIGQGGRVTIAIAHRLSTIQDADVIAVVKDGQVVELGTHEQLLGLDGVYSALCKEQDLNVLS